MSLVELAAVVRQWQRVDSVSLEEAGECVSLVLPGSESRGRLLDNDLSVDC